MPTSQADLLPRDCRVKDLAVQLAEHLVSTGAINRRPALSGLRLGAFFLRYIESYAKPHCSSWCDMERSFKNYFGRFAELDMYEIKRVDVQEWHTNIGETNGRTAANRAIELMVMLFNKAHEWDLIAFYNPASKVRKFKLQARERFLQPDELPRFFAALSTLRYPVTRDLFLMCLFTGARLGNVRSMLWEHVDFGLRTWTIPKTKNGTSQVVPLTMEAMSILNSRKRANETPWVFVNLDGTDHIKYVDLAWRELIRKAEIKDLRIHDLRRSLASWEAITGANTSVIAATLNHKSLSSTAIYARLNTSAVRGAMKTATQVMLEHAGIFVEEEPAELVVSLSTRSKVAAREDEEPWLTEVEIEEATGIPVNQLRLMRSRNSGPAYLKQGYSVKYKQSEVARWTSTQTI